MLSMHFIYTSIGARVFFTDRDEDKHMMSIGIIGAGVSALHLGIGLRNAGVDATIYAPKRPEDIASGRMQNSVAHMNDTLTREREMDIEFWDRSNSRVCNFREYHIKLPDGTMERSRGNLSGDERCVDYRIYLPRLMREFEERGGEIRYDAVTASNFDELYDAHSLLAIGTGKQHEGFGNFFPRVEELSLHTEPARLLCAGMYRGVTAPDPMAVTLNVSVGHGELVELPMETAQGPMTALLTESRHDGGYNDLMGLDYDADPDAFINRIYEMLGEHYPDVQERVDRENFELMERNALLQGKFTPVTRSAWSEISDGRFAVAIGDLRCTMDPLTGQGANLASYGAYELASHISESDGVYDRSFCESYEQRTQYRVAGVVNFNNALLEPNEWQRKLLHSFPHNQALVDDFSARFAQPETVWWDILKDEQTCQQYMAGFEAPTQAA